MAKELIINASLPEIRIALIENGSIQELQIERASDKGIVGNLYKGKVTRVLPGMQAAFVDIGLEKAAFLYVDDVLVPPAENDFHSPQNTSGQQTSGVDFLESRGRARIPSTHASTRFGSSSSELVEESQESAKASEPFSEGTPSEEESVLEKTAFEGEPLAEALAEAMDEEEDFEPSEEHSEEEPWEKMDTPPKGVDETQSLDVLPEPPNTTGESVGQPQAIEHREQPSRRPGRHAGRSNRRHHRSDHRSFHHENPHQDRKLNEGGDSLEILEKGEDSSVPPAVPTYSQTYSGRPHNSQRSQHSRGRPRFREEFQAQRSKDRRISPRMGLEEEKPTVLIQELLKEGQEVIVQVAKDPIAGKGARLTCHMSLPGRHLVCTPTVNHVGVSRRIERDDERRRLREIVERYRPNHLGFIVRTAGGRQQSEKRIQQDIDYLTHLWDEIQGRASQEPAPTLLYEDLNAVLRAVRDWVTDDVDRVIVDSRTHYQEMQKFASHFMPSLKNKMELYHGDIPIFDAYGISTELSRALEKKVWLKSGGYIVIDQAEALVAIDVNTGRYVGKKNLEDTILKTNLEAVEEIAYQLRLRNCGGIIILDLIDMEKEENKQRVYRALEDALMKDRARPSILKISELGLIEMTRKRTRDTMVRALCESCPHCEGKGFIKSKQTVAYEVLREVERESLQKEVQKILIQAHPEVIELLAMDERQAVDVIEKKSHKMVYLQAIQNFHPEQFEVSVDRKFRSQPQRSFSTGVATPSSSHRSGERPTRGAPPKEEALPLNTQENFSRTEENASQEGGEQELPFTQPSSYRRGPQKRGEVPQVSVRQAEGGGQEVAASSGGDEADEEDRLAFLRAQAVQEAALGGRSTGNPSASQRSMAGGGAPYSHRKREPGRDQGHGHRHGHRRPKYPPRRGSHFSQRFPQEGNTAERPLKTSSSTGDSDSEF